MQPVNQELFREWEKHPVTEAVKAEVRNRLAQATEEVVSNLSENKDYDVFLKGMIRAFREVLEVKLADVTVEEDENEV
jgi:uncharacterized membrane protein YheB (UPF0754 family)